MAINIKTPGVYINELDAFGNSIVGVPTSIPVFIGYTEKANLNGKDVANTPIKLTNFNEYSTVFGGAPNTIFYLVEVSNNNLPYDFNIGDAHYNLIVQSGNYLLYNAIELFYQNGGGECYIISIGDYNTAISQNAITNGLSIAANISDAALLVIPDANLLSSIEQYCDVVKAMLQQCATLKNRFAIIDVYNGTQDLTTNVIKDFRDGIGTDNLSYGASYYPFLNTTLVNNASIQYTQITPLETLNSLLEPNVPTIASLQQKGDTTAQISAVLSAASPNYMTIVTAVVKKINVQPPSGAMAGLYTTVDNENGVWVAPANISPVAVASPTVNITNQQQEDLNVPISGKAVNAIRFFTGRGTLVWGARTLDGNSNDWRYIQVRRTIIYIEQSIKNGLMAYVFAPNVNSTWVTVKASVSAFLDNLWKQGGLIGAKASDAYMVQVGLGTTMTSEDILNGYMVVQVSLQIIRPAEYIELNFRQQMQGN